MTEDLAMLPEEVREAIKDICESSDGLIFIKRWHTIRAELVRLMRDLKSAESERDALRKRIDESRHVTIGSYPARGFGYVQMICDPAKGISDKVYALVPLDDAEAAP